MWLAIVETYVCAEHQALEIFSWLHAIVAPFEGCLDVLVLTQVVRQPSEILVAKTSFVTQNRVQNSSARVARSEAV